jgi:SP family facilitated glucose transporter-like MFS transporter 8
MLTVDRWGRRPLLMISSIGMCICSFFIGLSYYLQKNGEFQKLCSVMLIVGLVVRKCQTYFQSINKFNQWTNRFIKTRALINQVIYVNQGYVSSFGIGLGGLPWVIMSEIFPVNVKITAGSLVTMSNWFFNWIIIYSFNFMIQWSASGKIPHIKYNCSTI